jgi:fructokinase
MIVVCGEALIDLFVGRPDSRGIATEAVAGGSPFNLALGLARLGTPSLFLSTLSRDAFGDHLLLRLEESRVDTRFIRRVSESTTLSVVATAADGQPHYTFHAEGADRALAPADLPDLPDAVTAIAAGSYALGVEPVASAIEALLRRERGRRVVSLDPNIRPRVLGDVAGFRPRFEALLSAATVVKASTEDIEHLCGAADPAEVARGWLARGPALVVVTAGAEGATAYFGDRHLFRAGLAVEVVDTVGAGDTFHAALLAHFSQSGVLSPGRLAQLTEAEVAAALDAATFAAAVTCTRRGADLPTRADVDGFRARRIR